MTARTPCGVGAMSSLIPRQRRNHSIGQARQCQINRTRTFPASNRVSASLQRACLMPHHHPTWSGPKAITPVPLGFAPPRCPLSPWLAGGEDGPPPNSAVTVNFAGWLAQPCSAPRLKLLCLAGRRRLVAHHRPADSRPALADGARFRLGRPWLHPPIATVASPDTPLLDT